MFPDDVVVADADGAVVIPAALLDHMLATAPEQERTEGWITDQMQGGAKLPGLYPMNPETNAQYEAQMAKRGGNGG